ncbi:MAG: hypothetical protein J0M04_12690 [Verrucomicrobia bacterium]|nr:hypothetical protein [Verrucomicrobiota bacterium]
MTHERAIDGQLLRLAVADSDRESLPNLGRAVRFVIFDVLDGMARTPCYRVRHHDPAAECDGNHELMGLLRDCQAVIAGAAGKRLADLLRSGGIRVIATSERRRPTEVAARYLAGTLTRKRIGPPGRCPAPANPSISQHHER